MLDRPFDKLPEKKRLAIVSTYDDLCGIAGYTRALVLQLEPFFDIEVFDLDQFMMRSRVGRVKKVADKQIKDFCDRAHEFDYVNIQLEHGTLGADIRDITRRFAMFAQSAPALSITFHTVPPQGDFDFGLFVQSFMKLKITKAFLLATSHIGAQYLNGSIYRLLRKLQREKPVSVIVHTRRDMRLMRYVNGLNSVHDHPLAFLPVEIVQKYRALASLDQIPGLGKLPDNAKVIGVFGFLSEYKGFDAVVRAMHHLPSDYHLLIFGGVHPSDIKRGHKIHPYVQQLLEEAYVGVSVIDHLKKNPVSLQINEIGAILPTDHPRNIGSRIHFLGAQSDEAFATTMTVCDCVVLPYLEVGQSSSGVLSIALEMQSRIIAARNRAFIQFTRYHPDAIELFEIGNYHELAEKIQAKPAFPIENRKTVYDVTTNAKLYAEVHSDKPHHAKTAGKAAMTRL